MNASALSCGRRRRAGTTFTRRGFLYLREYIYKKLIM